MMTREAHVVLIPLPSPTPSPLAAIVRPAYISKQSRIVMALLRICMNVSRDRIKLHASMSHVTHMNDCTRRKEHSTCIHESF